MTVELAVQKDYLLTEGSAKLPTDLNEWAEKMRKTKATGKIVAVFTNGGLSGVNIEQKTKATETESAKMRKTVGVKDEDL
jgi:hypothetical protein